MKFKITLNEALISTAQQNKIENALRLKLGILPIWKQKPNNALYPITLPMKTDSLNFWLKKAAGVTPQLLQAFKEAKIKEELYGDTAKFNGEHTEYFLVWVQYTDKKYTVYTVNAAKKLIKE